MDELKGKLQGAGMAAGVLVLAWRLVRALGLVDLTPEKLCEAVGVSRSQGYEWAARLWQMIETQPGPGRPAHAAEVDPDTATLRAAYELCKAVRDWLLQHPGGAMAGHKRNAYTDEFRSLIIDLLADVGEADKLTREEQADALGIRPDTLLRWLSPPQGRQTAQASQPAVTVPTATTASPTPAEVSTDASLTPAEASTDAPADTPATATAPLVPPPLPSLGRGDYTAQILELWRVWRGRRPAFYRCVREHGIPYSDGAIRSVLLVNQKLPLHPRRPPNPDAEATRGTYERPDPNTQWVEDGTGFHVTVGDNVYPLTLQQIVDNGSDYHGGAAVNKHECAQGLLDAFHEAEDTTGTTPAAILRDQRKCNKNKTIDATLEAKGVISQLSTIRHPQSNAVAENAIGRMKRLLPKVRLPSPAHCTEIELAIAGLLIAARSYNAGNNGKPKRRLNGRTPTQAQEEHSPSSERLAAERARMRRIQRRLHAEADTEARRQRETTLQLLREFFAEVQLQDPDDRMKTRIARYGLEAVTEAVAILQAKRQGGIGPEAHPDRYLLKTARRIAYAHQDTRTFERLLDLRIKAGDLIVTPLQEELGRLQAELVGDPFLKAVLYRATASATAADRVFWRRVFLAEFTRLPLAQRAAKGRWAAARIAGRLHVPYLERQYFLSLIAAAAVPLVA